MVSVLQRLFLLINLGRWKNQLRPYKSKNLQIYTYIELSSLCQHTVGDLQRAFFDIGFKTLGDY